MQLQYQVAAQAIEQDGKKYTRIDIIDESECKNKWRINPAGKARALAGVLETPLLGPPILGHDAIDAVGHPVDFVSNHSTTVLYEMKDPLAWEKVKSGEWQAVSPQLTFLKAHYEGDTLVVDEWRFDHVAFVEQGAFPNTGVKATCEGNPALCGFSKAVTAALQGHGSIAETDVGSSPQETGTQEAREKTGGHPNGGVIVKNTETKEVDACMKCEHEKVIAELTEKKTTLETQMQDLTEKNKALETEVKDLKAKTTAAAEKAEAPKPDDKPKSGNDIPEVLVTVQAELKTIKAENEVLKAWKLAQEETEHMKRVQGVVDLRVKAGLLDVKNAKAAIESLKKLPNEALDELRTDLETVQGKFDALPSGPKARLIPSSVSARFNPMQDTVGDLVGKKVGEA